MPIAGHTHEPLIINIGPFPITGFGLALCFGFVIGHIVGQRELERRGHNPRPISDVVFAALLGFLVGAKLYYVALVGDWEAFFSRSGLVFWGGLIGGVAAAMWMSRRRGVPIMRIGDVAGPGIAAGYAVGRTGCWAVGDDYGLPWQSPLAVAFPKGVPPSTAENLREMFGVPVLPGVSPDTVLAVHPTQLYEVALGFIMFLLLWRLRDHKHAEGWLFGLWMVLAGVERFGVEFLRAKDDRFFGLLTMAQVISIAFVAGGLLWMYARRSVTASAPGIYAEAPQVA